MADRQRPGVGVNVPLSLGTDVNPHALAAWLALAESSPADSIWTLDQASGSVPSPSR